VFIRTEDHDLLGQVLASATMRAAIQCAVEDLSQPIVLADHVVTFRAEHLSPGGRARLRRHAALLSDAGVDFAARHGLTRPFLLYVGRIDKNKGCVTLFAYFRKFLEETGADVDLVLAGSAVIPIPDPPRIRHVGRVSEDEKVAALRQCRLLVMPSPYESLSIIILEAWLLGIPVLVNGRCAVTKQQCRLSNGGLYYVSYREFAATLSRLLDNPLLRRKLGTQGHRFVRERYHWPEILTRYENMINRLSA